ncbi:MAG: C10 family peptidase, partial [Bacteroidales bacterium]|nr:C10 family peptidase [Bacteroidales bacterium]
MGQRSFSNALTILFVIFSVNLYSQSKGVDPLLTTYWAQACYYNDSCPEDPGGSCGHARTGCGATAMAQILKYFNFPENGIGFHSFYHPTYGNISANFENTYYDW